MITLIFSFGCHLFLFQTLTSSIATNAETIDSTQSLLNVNIVNITKLNSTKFMIWNLQVNTLLDGYDFAGYLVGSTWVHAQMIHNDGEATINPPYTKWRRQDRVICSGLISTLSPYLQALVTNIKSSHECGSLSAPPKILPAMATFNNYIFILSSTS